MWQTKYASAANSKKCDWELIFRRSVQAISSPGVRSLWLISYGAIHGLRTHDVWIPTSLVTVPLERKMCAQSAKVKKI